ncbi:LuxR C-terminal-related transcriptional regulator [Chloroflexi bacterium TSY]|nr:LuxR C-terminal-related transcriptional regulator [Chloroflexi bacterium TSY]
MSKQSRFYTGGSSFLLTRRERDVARLLTAGYYPGEIARRLHISRRTVEFHERNIREKLGVSCRFRAALRLVRMEYEERIRGLSIGGF